MFSIGQKVVCIADYSEAAASSWADELCIEMPVRGGVYTVRRVVSRVVRGDSCYGVMLDEVLNMKTLLDKDGVGGSIEIDSPRALAPDEIAFASVDFRPLAEAEETTTTRERLSQDA